MCLYTSGLDESGLVAVVPLFEDVDNYPAGREGWWGEGSDARVYLHLDVGVQLEG